MKKAQIVLLSLFTFWAGASFVQSQRQASAAKGYVVERDAGVAKNEEFTVVGGDNLPITQQITRKWVMSADGKTFTVDLFGKTPNGDLHTKRTFVKK